MMYDIDGHIGYDDLLTDDNRIMVMRAVRNRLLVESDWAMASDAPTDKEAWATYRQALRDFPATWVPAQIVEFPEVPA